MRRLWPLLLIVLAAFALRCYWTWDTVFADGFVRFGGADPWHHMRQVDALLANFPSRLAYDAYALHPRGQEVAVAPLLDYLIAVPAWIAGLGSPSRATVDMVGALAAPVLGALIPIPVFLLGRRLAGAAAGWFAAGLVAFMPGQLLNRTVLGFADHHVLEALLVPWTAVALLWALDRARESGVSFSDLRAGRRGALRRPLLDGAVAGLALFAYLASWVGGAVVLIVFLAWFVLQVQVDFLRGRSSDALALVCVPMYAVALGLVAVLLWNVSRVDIHFKALGTSLGVAALLPLCAAWLRGRGAARWMLPAATALVAVAGLLIVHLIRPGFLAGVWSQLSWFSASGVQVTVGEAQPLLEVGERRSWTRAWIFFGSALAYLPVGVLFLTVKSVRLGRPGDILLVIWTVAMVLLTLGQNRFAYYLAVNAALIAGVLFGPVLSWAWRDAETGFLRGLAQQILLPLAVLGFVAGPAVPDALYTARSSGGPDDDMVAALDWMRTNTPEPFGSADDYLTLRPARRKDSPPSAYGVLAWWDVGYWITRIAHRVPVANPTQSGAGRAARVFLSQSEEEALEILERLRVGYVITTTAMIQWSPYGGTAVYGQLRDMAAWDDGHDLAEFQAEYEVPLVDGGARRLTLFHEAYFRTLVFRLEVLDGAGYEPSAVNVVLLDPSEAEGPVIRARGMRVYPTYAAARAFLESLPPGAGRIVSEQPLESCTPLEPLARFRGVHESAGGLELGEGLLPNVRVFEVLPR